MLVNNEGMESLMLTFAVIVIAVIVIVALTIVFVKYITEWVPESW